MQDKVYKIRMHDIAATSAIFIAVLLPISFAVFGFIKMSISDRRMQVMNLAITSGNDIRRTIEHAISLDYTLEELVQHENGTINNFSGVSKRLLSSYPMISSLQLAPDGIVSQIEPLAGNEMAIGHDLFHDRTRAAEAKATRDSGKLTLGGPYELIQGGTGFIGRLPVFMQDKKHVRRFWGFVNVVISFDKVVNVLSLDRLESRGYAYELSKRMAGIDYDLIIASSGTGHLRNPVEWNFSIANTQWVFRIEPLDGWLNMPRTVFFCLVCFFLALFITFTYALLLQLKSRNKILQQLACIDQLTGLYTKQTGLFALEHEITAAKRHDQNLAVCFVDMNNFKQINDSCGHGIGDLVLVKAAENMKKCIREEDIAIRYGGDEFIVVFSGRDKEFSASAAASRLSDSLSSDVQIHPGTVVHMSAAVGTAIYPENGTTPDDLIRYADESMYEVKRRMKAGR